MTTSTCTTLSSLNKCLFSSRLRNKRAGCSYIRQEGLIMAAGLITQNTLRLRTEIGICQIELCVGDITQLQREDKVDVLVVSAFPGDYCPTPTSLIGQLQKQLGVSVRNLSKDKEEDLRRQYFCWWSKPLPEQLSFNRILCFEGGFGNHHSGTTPPKVIGAVFRCLVPILNNKEGSVIMPLLSCGDQGYSRKIVLRQLLNAAVHWMKAGLPLRTLKIVLFSRNPQKEDKTMEPLFQLFQDFKAKTEDLDELEKKEEEEDIVLYDIYISHCPNDHSMALQIKEFLQEKESKSLKIFDDVQELNEKESWQDDIYNTMVKCSRVVTLLSPGYLASDSCIEQYNIALCISRRKHKEVLAPFYVVSVEYLPTYMGLMQYIDCRPKDVEKLKHASISIKQWLEANNIEMAAASTEMKALTNEPQVAQDYEVFISYSHQNKDEALQMLKRLKSIDSSLNVFIDSSGLNTGASWQQSLYHAIDESKVMIALLSNDYLKSKVCKEEFSLALALHMDESINFKLVSVLIEDIELPQWCQKPKPVDCTSVEVEGSSLFPRIAKSISISLQQGYSEVESEIERRLANLTDEHISIDEFTQNFRKIKIMIRKNFLSESLFFPGHGNKPKSVAPSNEVACVVALSFAEEDASAAEAMKCLLLKKCPGLTISLPRTNATSRLNDLDVARVIIILLSPAYLNSKELVEELNIALYRHRSSSHQVVYPIQVSPLPPKPSYVRLLPYEFAAMDYSWMLRALGGQINRESIECLAEENDISASVASCLMDASDLIFQEISNTDDDKEHYQVLLNVLEVQYMWKQLLEKLSKEKGLDTLKRSFGIQVMGEESSASNKECGTDRRPVPKLEDQGIEVNDENVGTAHNKKPTSHHDASHKGKSVSFSSHVGATSGSYNLTKVEASKSCTVV